MIRNKIFKAALVAIFGALIGLVVVVLVACPAANNGGSGPGPGPGGGTGQPYLCANGAPVGGTTDTAGQTRCVSCNPLYKLDGTTDVVGTSCQQVAVGEATRIGMAMQFGIGEVAPTGLAAIGDTLYMVGNTADVLYTLNTTTGRATQVGTAPRGFGMSETHPRGLAAIGTTLYMVGSDTDALHTVDTGTGRAAQVGTTAAGFGVAERRPSGLAAIASTLYIVGHDTDLLHTLSYDPDDGSTDGMAYRVGTTAAGFNVVEGIATGLAAIDDTLYMVGQLQDALFTLNATTGSAIRVGDASLIKFGVSENTPWGLAAIGDTLYMVGDTADVLYALRYQ